MPIEALPHLDAERTERRLIRFVQGAIVTPKNKASTVRVLPNSSASDDLALYFFSTEVAEITPGAYVARLYRYVNCSEAAFLHALVLLRRLVKLDARLCISPYNVHRLLITAVMISAKFLDNQWFTSSYYARVGGIPSVAELNNLEMCMLKLLDYRIFVRPHEYVLEFIGSDLTLSLDHRRRLPPAKPKM